MTLVYPNLQDKEARHRAATLTDRNVVVTAGAGTGKTTLLVDRLVHLLVFHPVPIPMATIVALTFTNKAANEMKLRLRDRLAELQAMNLGRGSFLKGSRGEWDELQEFPTRFGLTSDRVAELAREALRDLDRSQISTIHSFAAHLLRLYPVESGLDPAFQEDDGSRFGEHFEQEWQTWLGHELGSEGLNHERWREVLRRTELEVLQQLAFSLCDELISLSERSHFGIGGHVPLHIREWLGGLLEKARELRTTHSNRHTLERMLDAAMGRLERLSRGEFLPEPSPSGREMDTGEEKILDRRLPNKTKTWPMGDYEQAKHLLKVAQDLGHASVEPFAQILELLIPFAERCRRRFVESGYVSFNGLLARARNLLRDRPEVRRELKEQFQAILVDEFQDTDPVQYELVIYLAEAAGSEASEWKRIRLEPGKLFIVGDPKQSIYSFRGADLEAYEAVVEDLVLVQAPHAERQSLQTNFRSHDAVLNSINTCFNRLFPESAIKGIQPHYQELFAGPVDLPPLPHEGVEMRLVMGMDEEVDAEEASRLEAENLARWLSQEVLGCQEIREFGNPVPMKPRHVALLFRTMTNMNVYLEAFRRCQIPYITEGERFFFERQEIIDFVNLLIAVANPFDRLALVGVLRSPLGGRTDAQIEVLARQNVLDYRCEETSSNDLVPPVYRVLREFSRELPLLPLTDLIDVVFAKVPFLELAAATMDGEKAVANLLKLRDMVAELAQRPDLTFLGLVQKLSKWVKDPPREPESSLFEEGQESGDSDGAVRVLSIHKAKGLEFPMVIVAGLHRGADPRRPRVWVHHDWLTGIIGVRLGDSQTLGGVYVSSKLQQQQQAEQVRLLYVAMTRASRRLVLSAGLPDGKSWRQGSLLSLVEKGMGLDLDTLQEVKNEPVAKNFPMGSSEIQVQVFPMPVTQRRQGHQERVWLEGVGDYKAFRARWEERHRRAAEVSGLSLFTSPSALRRSLHASIGPAKGEVGHEGNQVAVTRKTGGGIPVSDRGLLLGTLAHRILEGWDFAEDPGKLAEWIEVVCRGRIPMEWGDEGQKIITELHQLFTLFVASEPYASLRRAEILGREVPLALPWNERGGPSQIVGQVPRVMEGVIDVVYRLEGEVWIADYKTDRVDGKALQDLVKTYRDQICIYGEAVARCLGLEKVRREVIFLRSGRSVEI